MTWVGLIWAEAHGGVIGAEGGMPWNVPEDLAHFKEVTLGSPVGGGAWSVLAGGPSSVVRSGLSPSAQTW